ncbi:MAG: flagellar export chaperone FliS [Epsilonproteobacteria bacterium]|jgi:flagellar protein FliS|nr:flagellar export chaperone FliS [Campylobacterota bacterium]
MYSQAVSSYNQNNINIETPEKLIEMLYEGALRFTSFAKKSIEKDDIEKKVYWINRVINIFAELLASLDLEKGGDIALYLSGLYEQQIKFLIEANVNNDTEKLDIVIKVLKGLLEAWKEQNG